MADYASQEKGSVRIGPITLITLIIVVSMAVLAVLAITQSRTSAQVAQRQEDSVSATYANERAGQELLAAVDGALARTQQSGGGIDAAMPAIREVVPSVAIIEGNTVRVAYGTQNGRLLDITLTINDNLTYTVTKWKTSVDWDSKQ